jgi:ribosomal protein RSM22 (predicted rRNA methylase)
MHLPEQLRNAVAGEIAAVDRAALSRATGQLSDRYRAGKFSGAIAGPADRAAYLATRLPATYAANVAVFRELTARVQAPVRSLLDLGAGPGTAMWAAAEALPDIESLAAVERDPALIEVGKRLAASSGNAALQHANWIQADFRALPDLAAHDVVVVSYAMGELQDPLAAVRSAWQLARVALVLIEPGTPRAFDAVLRARDLLIESGAQIAAPCPHHKACPLAVRNDWCHFSVRLERTSEHRRLKGGDLGYEDEKFSYLIASKVAGNQASARIVRHPLKYSGHVKLALCTPDDLQRPTITKSQKELYRAARKAEWGDEWPPLHET